MEGVSVSEVCETCVNVMSEILFFCVFAVCNKMTKYRAISPFLCMDMTYITCLLKEGFGFKDSTVLQVSKPEPQRHKIEKASQKNIIFCLKHCIFPISRRQSIGNFPFVVVMEMLLSLCSSTASQEGEQRGDELGPRGDLRLLQKPQHPPLRAARCHCSRH